MIILVSLLIGILLGGGAVWAYGAYFVGDSDLDMVTYGEPSKGTWTRVDPSKRAEIALADTGRVLRYGFDTFGTEFNPVFEILKKIEPAPPGDGWVFSLIEKHGVEYLVMSLVSAANEVVWEDTVNLTESRSGETWAELAKETPNAAIIRARKEIVENALRYTQSAKIDRKA